MLGLSESMLGLSESMLGLLKLMLGLSESMLGLLESRLGISRLMLCTCTRINVQFLKSIPRNKKKNRDKIHDFQV